MAWSVTADTFAALFVAGVLAIYFAQLQWRRQQYRRIAAELGAAYLSQGQFKSGKIAGSSDGRKYTVENRSGLHGSMWTTIEMSCANRGIPLHIHGRFFKDFPNWSYAFTEGERTERVFATSITVQGTGVPLQDKSKIEVQSLFQEFAISDADFLKRGRIRIERESLSFARNGVVKKLEEIRETLSVLARLAERIEATPIV